MQLAQQRWREQEKPDLPLTALGVDVARGGKDKTVLSERYGHWFESLQKHAGSSTPDGQSVAALATVALGDTKAACNLDCIGVGASALDFLVENGVNVNAIAPTFVETPGTEKALSDPAFKADVEERIAALHRIGQPGDVTGAVVFLVSPAASLITGHTIVIDGGWTAR